MANPQKGNGYTAIANEIMEVIQKYKFTLNELKIVLSVFRFTYGFQRKEHDMSLGFLEKHTGLSRSRINASLKDLIEKNVLIKTVQGNAKKTNKYSFNKNYESWKMEMYKGFTSVQDVTSVQDETSVQDVTDTSVQDETSTSVQDVTKEINIKENINKKEDDSIIDLLLQNNLITVFGVNKTLRDDIEDIYTVFKFDDPEVMIKEAIKDAARGNGRTWKFVYNKLNDWRKQGFKNPNDLEKEDKPSYGSNTGSFKQTQRATGNNGRQYSLEPPPIDFKQR